MISLSNHRVRQINIATVLSLLIILGLGLGNWFYPYWIARAIRQIFFSTLLGWGISFTVQLSAENLIGIGKNSRGDYTLENKFTKNWFGSIISIVFFIITSIIAFIIEVVWGDQIHDKAIEYSLSNAPRIWSIVCFIIAGLIFLFRINVNSRIDTNG